MLRNKRAHAALEAPPPENEGVDVYRSRKNLGDQRVCFRRRFLEHDEEIDVRDTLHMVTTDRAAIENAAVEIASKPFLELLDDPIDGLLRRFR